MTSSQSEDDRPANAKAELERLTKLRRDVAAGLMEVSRSAKHDAETLLAADESSEIPDYPGGIDDIGPAAAQPAQTSNARLYSTFGLGLAIGLTVSLFFAPFGSESPDSANADAPERAPELATPRPTAPVAPTPPSPPGTRARGRQPARARRRGRPATFGRGAGREHQSQRTVLDQRRDRWRRRPGGASPLGW